MGKFKGIAYEKHPVSAERKAELRGKGLKIIDAIFAPKGSRSDAEVPQNPEVPSDPDALRIAKGPGGRLYLKLGKDIFSGPFASQHDADAALAAETGA